MKKIISLSLLLLTTPLMAQEELNVPNNTPVRASHSQPTPLSNMATMMLPNAHSSDDDAEECANFLNVSQHEIDSALTPIWTDKQMEDHSRNKRFFVIYDAIKKQSAALMLYVTNE